jgi:hypothetical protein
MGKLLLCNLGTKAYHLLAEATMKQLLKHSIAYSPKGRDSWQQLIQSSLKMLAIPLPGWLQIRGIRPGTKHADELMIFHRAWEYFPRLPDLREKSYGAGREKDDILSTAFLTLLLISTDPTCHIKHKLDLFT